MVVRLNYPGLALIKQNTLLNLCFMNPDDDVLVTSLG